MSDISRNNRPEDSIEETRRKKMEEFRRSADRNAIRGDYDSDRGGYDPEEPVQDDPYAEEPAPRLRRKNREINSYSDNDTKKKIERESKKALKQQKKEEKKLEKSKAKRNRRIFKLVWIAMIVLVGITLSQFLLVGVNDLLAISRDDNPTKVMIHVPADPTMDEIATLLHDANVINEPGFFKLYASFTSSQEGIIKISST